MRERVKADSKRLIQKAMGRAPPEMDRNVKAWLKPGPAPELPAIEGAEEKYKNALVLSHRMHKQHVNLVQDMIDSNIASVDHKLAVRFQSRDAQDHILQVDYTKIRRLYNVSLLDFDKETGKEHLD